MKYTYILTQNTCLIHRSNSQIFSPYVIVHPDTESQLKYWYHRLCDYRGSLTQGYAIANRKALTQQLFCFSSLPVALQLKKIFLITSVLFILLMILVFCPFLKEIRQTYSAHNGPARQLVSASITADGRQS